MAKTLQLRRGTTAENDAFTGAVGEITVDTEKHELRLHDGSTQGGHRIALADLLSAYLPLAGGTMVGQITSAVTDIIKSSIDSANVTIHGGTGWSNGASLQLFGKNHANNPGLFQISCRDGSTIKDLVGRPNGTLTWNGNDVLRWIKRGSSSGNGYFVFQDGLCIQYGTASVTGHATITMPVEMRDNSYYVLVTPFANASAVCATVGDRTATGFPVHVWNTIKTSNTELTTATRIFWLAVYKQKS